MMSPAASHSLRATLALILGLGAALFPLTAIADRPEQPGRPDRGKRVEIREGYLLVKPRAGLPEEKLGKTLRDVDGDVEVERELRGLKVKLVKVPHGREAEMANALNRNPHIEFAEPDTLVAPDAVVNDPSYSSQWHLPVIGAPSAWTYANGKGVTVAVCDTGVYAAHPDLAGQTVPGWNTASNSADTSDINGHGTYVTGTIAAAANNVIGGASVAPGARVMAMRITDRTDGYAYFSDMAECVAWAADHGARVANISFEGVPGSFTVANAASYLMSKGGLVVVAAGNSNIDGLYSNSPYLFTVAATASGDVRASYSNFGAYIDVAAPGSGIFTTNRSGSYSSVSGTSFASPNAAAVAALVMSANPDLTPTDVTAIITNTAKDLGDPGWDKYYGFGRVDAGAAVAMAASVATSDKTAPAVAVATPSTGAEVHDLVTVDVQAQDDFGVASIDLLVDGSVVANETGEDPTTPYVYRFAWDSRQVADGEHRLTARARDAAGNVGGAQEVAVTVYNAGDRTPPALYRMGPEDGATVTGDVQIVGARFQDDVAMANVVVTTSTGVQFSSTRFSDRRWFKWDLTKVPEGWHEITAIGTDTSGNQTTVTRRVYVSKETAASVGTL
jgi:thermitase